MRLSAGRASSASWRFGSRTISRRTSTARQAMAAVGAVMAAIEIVDDRYVDWRALDAPTLTADDFFGAGCVLGRDDVAWRDLDLGRCRRRWP